VQKKLTGTRHEPSAQQDEQMSRIGALRGGIENIGARPNEMLDALQQQREHAGRDARAQAG
jgi:hypothetical protein